MKITQHSKYLYQLTQTFPFGINAFLVREADGFTLIDTAFGRAKAIVAAAQSISGNIRRIALTHSHSDHVGSLDLLHQILPDAEVLIGRREAKLMQGDRSSEAGESPVKGQFGPLKFQPARLLEPGNAVGSLRVIAAPGHSPGQIAFFDERDQSLIAGDAFIGTGGFAVSGTLRPLFPFPTWSTWDKNIALQTAQRLRALKPSRLAIGHGNTLENPLAAMDQVIAEAERKLKSPLLLGEG